MQGVRSPRYGALPWRFPALGFVLILFLAFQLSLYFWVVTPGLHFPAQGAVPHCIGPELVPPTKYGPITVNAKDYSCPLNPRPLFDRTATERQCDESHSFALVCTTRRVEMCSLWTRWAKSCHAHAFIVYADFTVPAKQHDFLHSQKLTIKKPHALPGG